MEGVGQSYRKAVEKEDTKAESGERFRRRKQYKAQWNTLRGLTNPRHVGRFGTAGAADAAVAILVLPPCRRGGVAGAGFSAASAKEARAASLWEVASAARRRELPSPQTRLPFQAPQQPLPALNPDAPAVAKGQPRDRGREQAAPTYGTALPPRACAH